MSIIDNLPDLVPIDFFPQKLEIVEGKKTKLPDMSAFLGEDSFSRVYLTVHEKGISIELDIEDEDSFEVFIDTRDIKTSGFPTRFCHHFIFSESESREITRCRAEEAHPLCEPSDLIVEITPKKMHITIPAHCLHGYDTTSFKKLGFTYRLTRATGRRQHFAVSSEYYTIEKHPSLWASIGLL